MIDTAPTLDADASARHSRHRMGARPRRRLAGGRPRLRGHGGRRRTARARDRPRGADRLHHGRRRVRRRAPSRLRRPRARRPRCQLDPAGAPRRGARRLGHDPAALRHRRARRDSSRPTPRSDRGYHLATHSGTQADAAARLAADIASVPRPARAGPRRRRQRLVHRAARRRPPRATSRARSRPRSPTRPRAVLPPARSPRTPRSGRLRRTSTSRRRPAPGCPRCAELGRAARAAVRRARRQDRRDAGQVGAGADVRDARTCGVRSWSGINLLGGGDGANLADPGANARQGRQQAAGARARRSATSRRATRRIEYVRRHRRLQDRLGPRSRSAGSSARAMRDGVHLARLRLGAGRAARARPGPAHRRRAPRPAGSAPLPELAFFFKDPLGDVPHGAAPTQWARAGRRSSRELAPRADGPVTRSRPRRAGPGAGGAVGARATSWPAPRRPARSAGRAPALAAPRCCLYWAGMAANDWADRELDAVERPERPIPSGRVAPRHALGARGRADRRRPRARRGRRRPAGARRRRAAGRRGLGVRPAGQEHPRPARRRWPPAGRWTCCSARAPARRRVRRAGRGLTVAAHTYTRHRAVPGRGARRPTARRCSPATRRPRRRRRAAAGRAPASGDRRPRGRLRPRRCAAGRRRLRRATAPAQARAARRPVGGAASGPPSAPASPRCPRCRARSPPGPGRSPLAAARRLGRPPLAGRRGAVARAVGRRRPGSGAAHERLRFGYGTNGFANHRLDDALAVIADLGYDGVALTLDHHHLDPFARTWPAGVAAARRPARRAAARRVVVETGARYLLDPWRKHAPTLLDDEPAAARWSSCAGRSRSAPTSAPRRCRSGPAYRRPTSTPTTAWRRLVDGCAEVVATAAERRRARSASSPSPACWSRHRRLAPAARRPRRARPAFGITLDIGHCRCLEPQSRARLRRRASPATWSTCRSTTCAAACTSTCEFGAGEIDFPPVLRALTTPATAAWSRSSCPGTRTPRRRVAARSPAASCARAERRRPMHDGRRPTVARRACARARGALAGRC